MLGLSVGSFLNVCIYRMPRDLSIVKPRSYCPHCHQPIKFYQNIPLISFILQKGKCAGCEKNISWRYPLVELISGILTLAIFFIFGFSIDAIMYSVFCYALIVVTFIDIDFRVIPDIISVGGILVGVLFSFFAYSVSWKESLIGAAIGSENDVKHLEKLIRETEDSWVSRKYTSEKLTNSIRMNKKVEALFKDLEIIEF